MDVAIHGASGYAGGELVRFVDAHPELRVAYLGAKRAAGSALGSVHPQLSGGDRVLQPVDGPLPDSCELAFLALPHGASAEIAMDLLAAGIAVVDVGSDFRFDSPPRYLEAYGADHPYPDQLGIWPYGLPELFRNDLIGSDRAAVPGCYPTSAVLALSPLVTAGLVDPGHIVVDSLSGVSGAGRGASPELHFGAVDESAKAYGVTTHRHRPEMEQALGPDARVVFTPHLVPMQRGILTTAYVAVRPGVGTDDLKEALVKAYAAAPFVDVVDVPPETRWVVGSNRCLIWATLDLRSGTAIVLSALDNLVKGAAGQAVQCANVMLGFEETAGLPEQGWMP